MNPLVHFEMPCDDPERIATFYRSVFAWRIREPGEDMGKYLLATSADADVRPGSPAEAIDGGFYARKAGWPSQHPSIVIALDDIEQSCRVVAAAGGKVPGAPMSIAGVGRYVAFLDTEGNRCSMLQAVVQS